MSTQKTLLTIGAILLADYLIAKNNPNPKLIFNNALPFQFNAQTLPPFGILIKNEHAENEKLIAHENEHWKQYQKTGAIIFYLKYIAQLILNGYDNMPLEIEARQNSGEYGQCLKNYTHCVRTGSANTVKSDNFRIL
jgi:hypothetical protein